MMSTISYAAIKTIAKRLSQAHIERSPMELTSGQVALLDEWMQDQLELQADAEWLARAAISDERRDFIRITAG